MDLLKTAVSEADEPRNTAKPLENNWFLAYWIECAYEQFQSVTLTIDQGSDGWSSAHVHSLMSKGANMLLLSDPSHRAWNDAQLAADDCNFQGILLSAFNLFNADQTQALGPVSCGTMKQTAEEYEIVSRSERDGFFQAFMHLIVEGTAAKGLGAECDLEDVDAFRSLSIAVQKKINKVAMSRWFGVITTLRSFLPMHAKRLVISLYLALSMGMFKKGKAKELLLLPELSNPVGGADIKKASTAVHRREIQAARTKYQNTLAFCTALLSDTSAWRTLQLISAVLTPLEEWHSWQNKLNRSSSESMRYWQELAGTCGLKQKARQRLAEGSQA
eukprot:3605920-Amphidinium_carterae.1